MEELKELLEVADRLLGEGGCPWDRKQTLQTLQPYLLEEAHELIEAIDMEDPKKMEEELGDVLYTVIFISKLAEKKGFFTLFDSMRAIKEKLIRRHPHIFGDVEVQGVEDVMKNWEEIKMKEGRKSPFEGIPPTLPALSRAQKIINKQNRKASVSSERAEIAESVWVKQLWSLIEEADRFGFDAESALRRACMEKEKHTGD